MAAQLTCEPIIKITFPNKEVFDEVVPGYVFDAFRLTKGLLKPNKFEFIISREELTLETSDIDFELRDKLLTAMVEVTLKARYYDVGGDEMKEYDVEDFFYGYIQNIKVYRTNGDAVKFKCIAYSPDAKMKHHPACMTFNESKLDAIVNYVTAVNVTERMTQYDRKAGTYSEENNWLNTVINPATEFEVMPYTVQYNESPYDFLARLAKRYAEFMYYENRAFVWGKMVELPEIHLHNGADLEEYSYEMNMNDHEGIIFSGIDPIRRMPSGAARSIKKSPADIFYEAKPDILEEDGYQNGMMKSAFNGSSEYYGDLMNSFVNLGAAPLLDKDYKNLGDELECKKWKQNQRRNLERYVVSDSLICRGTASRVDLKLGSVIVIEDKTKTGDEKTEEWVAHKPLKVIELAYIWGKDNNLEISNRFKAIPQDAIAPPYLERDKDGFLVYGSFDIYPHCGPHYGIVQDNVDPEHLGRVRVALSWQLYNTAVLTGSLSYVETLKNLDNLTPWIWVASPYQGHQHGSLVIPEIGDLVLVGFEQNNAERPYVIGSRFYNSAVQTDWANKDENMVKGFRTRSGHTVEFIDAEGNNGFEGYYTGGMIHIYDSNSHAYDIVFDTDKRLIRLKSKGNIELSAGGSIAMHAGSNIVLDAGNDINVTAKKNISRNAGDTITDKAVNDYFNEVGNDMCLSIKDSDDTHIHMIKDAVHLQLHKGDSLLRLDGEKGVALYSKEDIIVNSDKRSGLRGKDRAAVASESEVTIQGKTIKAKADTEANIEGQAAVNIKGGVVKLN